MNFPLNLHQKSIVVLARDWREFFSHFHVLTILKRSKFYCSSPAISFELNLLSRNEQFYYSLIFFIHFFLLLYSEVIFRFLSFYFVLKLHEIFMCSAYSLNFLRSCMWGREKISILLLPSSFSFMSAFSKCWFLASPSASYHR